MKTSFISTFGTSQAIRTHLLKMQSELVKLEKEVVTMRVADSGLHLGARTGHSLSLERDVSRLKGIIDSNELASARLSSTQHGLSTLGDLSGKLQSTLTAGASGAVDYGIALSEAETVIGTLTGVLNTSLNGENLYAGVNTDVTPINDFFAAGSTQRTAILDAFQTHFGFAYDSAQANTVTADAMTAFLDNVIEPQFTGADWNTHWSNASDTTITARITLTETTSASVSANIDGVRRLAAAAASIAALFKGGNLNDNAKNAVVVNAASLSGQAVADIAQTQAKTGIVEQRVTAATNRLSMQVDIFSGKVNDLVGVDPYEASTRVQSLLAQLETAYTLTSRISQLSLVRYLP